MKNMKKIISIILTLCIISMLSVSVFADAVEVNDTSTYKIKVTIEPKVAGEKIAPGKKLVANFALVEEGNADGVAFYQSAYSTINEFLYYPEILKDAQIATALDDLTLNASSGLDEEAHMLFLQADFAGSGLKTIAPTDTVFTVDFTVAEDAELGSYKFDMGTGDDAAVFELKSVDDKMTERGSGVALETAE